MTTSSTPGMEALAKAKHTPGPWRLVFRNKNREFNSISVRCGDKANQQPVALVTKYGKYYERAIANANLIAASPELLWAAKLMWDNFIEGTPITFDDEDRIEAAILQATGEAS